PGPGRAEEMKPRARRSPHARYTPAGQDGIGHLELTRPEKLNATDDDSVGDLDHSETRAARDRKARAVIVRGLGRAFCTGIGLSAVRHGIIPGLATYRLPHLIGMGAAREMMLLGETWDAARAHRQGLVGRVVPLERLEATALDLATKLAANVRAASVATKRLILRSHDRSLGRFLGEYVRSQRGCWNDRETRETLA